jgi:hypothetical protein
VISVQVREEHLFEIDKAYVRAQQLSLCPLPAVDEQTVASVPEQRGRGAPARGRCRAGGAEKDEVEVHGGRSYRGVPADRLPAAE